MAILRDVDGLLRGSFTRSEDLAQGRVTLPMAKLVLATLFLGAIYGVFMGLYAVLQPEPGWAQMAATAVKVPLLFLLTLAVTFPSLYVFSALARTRLQASETLQLLLVAVAVNLAVLASFGPVTGFFTLSTESYAFMKLLNVGLFAFAGVVGIGFLRRALRTVFDGQDEEGNNQRKPNVVLHVWVLIYAMVGAQMGWILRPFIGAPDQAFELFRERRSNILVAVLRSIADLFP